MSNGRTATNAASRVGSGAGRLIRAFRVMPHEQRLAAYGAIGLFLTMFLPWYQRTFFVVVNGRPRPASDSLTAWGAFSFVEAAVLLVSAGVLTLLFQRAEGKAFHLPGGDGVIITIAGLWTCGLIVWRIFDKQGATATTQNVTSSGIEWGIFVALGVAAFLAYAGSRIRAAHQPEPPLPGEEGPPGPGYSQPPSEPGPPAPGSGRPVDRPGSPRAGTDGRPQRPRFDPEMDRRVSDLERDQRRSDPERDRRRYDPVPPHEEAPEARRERRVGWLTAPPTDRDPLEPDSPPADWPAPEWRSSSAPGPPAEPAADDPRPPRPVAADDPPTIRASRQQPAPLPPSTTAARRRQQSDDQPNIPLERED